MQLITITAERVSMVWFLLGLLFSAAGLYLGFNYPMAFGYLIVGWLCCAYGVTSFVLHRRAGPQKTAATRLSPDFISAGATVVFPTTPDPENKQAAER